MCKVKSSMIKLLTSGNRRLHTSPSSKSKLFIEVTLDDLMVLMMIS